MTVIRNNSISGINSITAQSGALNFYDSTGNTLSIGADVTGGVTVATGATISGSTNTIVASTNGIERVRIDADGNFNLVNTAGVMTAFKYETPALINNHFKSNSTSSGDYVRMYAGSGTGKWDIYGHTANLRFSDNDGAGNIQMDRPLVMNSQNIVMSSGNGIDFSATADSSATMDSEILNDYEEGTWSPTFQGEANNNNPTISYATRRGRYTKIGRYVCVHGFLQCNTVSSTGTTLLQIGNFPFTVGVDSDTNHVTTVNIGQATSYSNSSPSGGYLRESQNGAYLTSHNGTSWELIETNHLTNTSTIFFTINYITSQ